MPRVTVDGTPLCELGLGLGPTTNGKNCSRCDHHGYTVYEQSGLGECQGCDGIGVYTHPVHGIRRCPTCYGRGQVNYKVARILVLRCSECKGAGEIQIFNPVLPKGRLAFIREQDAA